VKNAKAHYYKNIENAVNIKELEKFSSSSVK